MRSATSPISPRPSCSSSTRAQRCESSPKRCTGTRPTTVWRAGFSLPDGSTGRSASEHPRPGVDADRQKQDDAECDLLVEGVDAEKIETVADQRDEQHADDGSPDGALAAED